MILNKKTKISKKKQQGYNAKHHFFHPPKIIFTSQNHFRSTRSSPPESFSPNMVIFAPHRHARESGHPFLFCQWKEGMFKKQALKVS